MAYLRKRVLVNIPAKLYNELKKIAQKRYRSVSSLITESILERVEEELTEEEKALIEEGRKAFRKGKGVNWREIKRA